MRSAHWPTRTTRSSRAGDRDSPRDRHRLDLPLLRAPTLVTVFYVVVGNLVADVIHARIDPRASAEARRGPPGGAPPPAGRAERSLGEHVRVNCAAEADRVGARGLDRLHGGVCARKDVLEALARRQLGDAEGRGHAHRRPRQVERPSGER